MEQMQVHVAHEKKISSRYGRFSVSASFARSARSELRRIMGKCIIFRAELLFISDKIEYCAESEHFRALSEGEIMPEYRWMVSEDGWLWCEEVIGTAAFTQPAGVRVI